MCAWDSRHREGGAWDDVFGRIVDVTKAAASCRTPKVLTFSGRTPKINRPFARTAKGGAPSTYDLPSDRAKMAAADLRGPRRAETCNGNAGQCDQDESRGARVHLFRGARRGENHGGAHTRQGAELREWADAGALRGMRFVQGDCGRVVAGRHRD